MHKIKQLQKIGFSGKEAKIYIACLELGTAGVSDIAKKTGLAKSTVHDVLKTLIQKRMVHRYLKKKRSRFAASDPQILKELQEKQNLAIDKILPELEALYGTPTQKAKVMFYEDVAGVEQVLDQILKEAKSITAINSAQDIFELIPQYFPSFSEARRSKNIPLKIIWNNTEKARERQKTDTDFLRQSKIISSTLPFPSILWMWNNKLAIMTFQEKFSVIVIEDREAIEIIKSMFELIWEHVPEASR